MGHWDSIKRAGTGRRIVIAMGKVVSAHPIESPAAGQTFAAYVSCCPQYPVTYLYDGEVRGEYGRPLDAIEIVEAMVDAGMLA